MTFGESTDIQLMMGMYMLAGFAFLGVPAMVTVLLISSKRFRRFILAFVLRREPELLNGYFVELELSNEPKITRAKESLQKPRLALSYRCPVTGQMLTTPSPMHLPDDQVKEENEVLRPLKLVSGIDD